MTLSCWYNIENSKGRRVSKEKRGIKVSVNNVYSASLLNSRNLSIEFATYNMKFTWSVKLRVTKQHWFLCLYQEIFFLWYCDSFYYKYSFFFTVSFTQYSARAPLKLGGYVKGQFRRIGEGRYRLTLKDCKDPGTSWPSVFQSIESWVFDGIRRER